MVHLHTRSCYSLLKSPFRISQIVQAARKNGFSSAALTDEGVLYGVMEFYHACKKENIHPVIGMECTVLIEEKPVRLVLLAKNDAGLQNLYRLSYALSENRNGWIDLEAARDYLQECFLILSAAADYTEELLQKNDLPKLDSLLENFAPFAGSFYFGMSMNDSAMRRERNVHIKSHLKEQGIPTVALSLIYYENKQDVEQLKVLRAIEKGTLVSDSRLDAGYERFYRDAATMQALYDEDDLQASDAIAAACQVEMIMKKSGLPHFQNRFGIDSASCLSRLCHAGLKKRAVKGDIREYQRRLEYELQVIHSMSYDDYFLIVYDFIRFARSRNIYVGPGRGSAAGSLVAYCLGITHIDPIANHLLFERFLNPDRISLPDIDTDVPDNRRQEIIEYLEETYGKGHVAQIVTFSAMKARSVLRDIGRVYAMPVRTIDTICKLIPSMPGMTLSRAYEQVDAFRRIIQENPQNQMLFEMGLQLEGLPRHTSIHAAGIVLSDQPIEAVCPCMHLDGQMDSTQFEMEYLEELGLIKMDILALRNLTIIAGIAQSVKEREGIDLDLLKLDLHDPKTYALLQRADTIGVFQLESDGIKQLILQMHPVCFEDISQIIALYRPGPMKNISLFLERKNHPERVEYLHPLLKPILQDTYGIIVYQEQIMEIARVVGGFTLAQADSLRKAMSKKKKDVMDSYEQQFLQGALQRGVALPVARQIFSWMESFADYGFNKSHSYAYGLIVYQMAWLKANYPLYFYQSLLESVIGAELKTAEYIYECHRRKIPVLPVDIQTSNLHYKIVPQGLLMPLTAVKGLGRQSASRIVAQQQQKPFLDLYDCIARLLYEKISESSLRTLIDAGAFDRFGYNRATLLKNLGRLLEYCQLIRIDAQPVLFDYSIASKPDFVKVQENMQERSEREYAAYGFYFSEHPVQSLREKYYQGFEPIAYVLPKSGFLQVIGRIASFKIHKTKKGDLMSFVSLEDETQKIDIVIMPYLLSRVREKLAKGRIMVVKGKKDRPASMLANEVQFPDV